MSVIEILGLSGYTRTGSRQEYDQSNGESTVVTYQGPVSNIETLYAASKLDIQDGTVDKASKSVEDGLGVLELSYADGNENDDDPNTVLNNTIWELVGQDLYKSIRSYNGDVSIANGDPLDSEAFNKDADQADLEQARLYFETAGVEGSIGVAEPAATYIQLLYRGTDQYLRSSAILRSTLTVSRRSLVTASWTGVDRAWKLSGDAASGGPDLNVGQAALIGAIETMAEADGTLKQWLKRAPQLTMSGRKSYTIIQEWWFARAWSANLYAGDQVDGNP